MSSPTGTETSGGVCVCVCGGGGGGGGYLRFSITTIMIVH